MRIPGRVSRTVLALAAVAALALAFAQGSALAQTLEDKIQKFDLKNGMQFIVVERHEAPTVFCAVAFNVGAANEWPNVTGISHMLEHMMFKGTEMMGTTNYKKEIPYIEKLDVLGEKTIALRKEIGEWRFVRFKAFGTQVMNAFTEEEKTKLGTNKYEQAKLLVAKIRAMKPLPDSLATVQFLVEDGGKNYLDLYIDYETTWGEISRLLDEQRQYIVKDELWEFYMNNGSRFLNAFTSNDFTVYLASLPANRLELFMTLESDRMESPVFREFWSERDVLMEERRLGENDPDEALSEPFYAVAFTASPYKWPVTGWMSDLQTIDRKELAGYHQRFYAPNNAVCVISGDVSLATVKKLAEKYFGPIKPQPQPPSVETREPEQTGERRITVEHTANPKIMIGYHRPIYPDPDAVALDVLESILGQGRTSRLYKTVFTEKELTAEEPNVYDGPGNRYDNLLIIDAMPRAPHTLEEVEGAIYEEIEKIKKEPVSERELERVKNQIDANLIRQLGSNIGIAFTAAFGQLFYGDYHQIFRSIERTKAVTAADVQRVAQKYLVPRNRTVAWRVQVEKGAGAEEEIDEQALRQYIMSLPQEERMEVIKKFQSMRSEAEAMKYARELLDKMKAAQKK